MLFLHLNEISGGCDKILLVSGSFRSKLNLFKNDVLWVESKGEWNSLVRFLL